MPEHARRILSKNATLVFRRWSHKGYSAFISMHREVRVGVVSIAISARLASKAGVSASMVPGFISRRNKEGHEDDDGFLESPPGQACWQFLLAFALIFIGALNADESCSAQGGILLVFWPFYLFLSHSTGFFPFSPHQFRHSRFCSIDIKKASPWSFDDISCLRLGLNPYRSFFLTIKKP